MMPLVTDAPWERLQPLLPPPPPRRFRFPGRKPLDYRKILTGILFVLKTGIAWDDLLIDQNSVDRPNRPAVAESHGRPGVVVQALLVGRVELSRSLADDADLAIRPPPETGSGEVG